MNISYPYATLKEFCVGDSGVSLEILGLDCVLTECHWSYPSLYTVLPEPDEIFSETTIKYFDGNTIDVPDDAFSLPGRVFGFVCTESENGEKQTIAKIRLDVKKRSVN